MSELPKSSTSRMASEGPTPMAKGLPKQLGTFCEFKYGRSLPEKDRRGGAFPVYGSNGIVGWHREPITNGPTIIIGRKGSAGALQYSSISCCPIDTTYYVDRSCTSVDLKWLFFMLGMLGLDALDKHAAVPGLNRNDAYEKELVVPTPDEQRRIAAVLDKAEALRRLREESFKLTEKILKFAFIDVFGDPLTNPKELPTRRLGEFFVSPKEGAKCGPFGSALKKSDFQASGVPVWGIDNISADGRFVSTPVNRISVQKFDELMAYSVRAGDVIVSRAGTVGRMCVVEGADISGIIGTNLIRLRLNAESIHPHYFVSLMRYFKDRLGRLRAGADEAFSHMGTGVLQNLEFPYPPPSLQERFLTVMAAVDSLSALAQTSNNELNSLFSAIQQHAFRGDLDLSRVRLESQTEIPTASDSDVSSSQSARREGTAFLVAPSAVETELDRLTAQIHQDGPMPWSADYFKYRVLGTMSTPFSFDDLMQKASGFFDGEPHYEEIKDIMLELLGLGGAPALLRQRLDLTVDEATNEVGGRKQIVFEPVS